MVPPMYLRHGISVGCALFLLGLAPGANSASAALSDLVSNSPFVPPGGSASSAPVDDNAAIELRGIVQVGNEIHFGIFDASKNRGEWVRLNQTADSVTVTSYDAASDRVVVRHNGRELTLALKEAKIVSSPPPQAVANAPQGGPPQPSREAQANGASSVTSSAERLERVAEEIRRRRALRAQAGSPAQPPATR